MFDLAAFDAEIDRRRHLDQPGDDVLLTKVLRGPMGETGLTPFGLASGSVLGALAVASLLVPMMFGTGPAQAMTFSGMTIDQFAVHMNMSQSDPLLIAMFEQLCML